ncbi:MAG TPA: TIGR03086 family metal-binding protein [Actinomycetota bacterium]|nr:TIGR03086 family metal-binding protein [Actinomycetota bacterium]
MTDVLDLYARAVDAFGGLLRRVPDGAWSRPTPCTDWDVRALANHVLGENRWMPPMMAGKTVAEVGDAFDGDLLGDDPAGAWDEAASEALAAVREPGALERTVHLSFGDFPGRYYVGQVLSDHVIHSWDLARALGAGERLDPELVRFAYDELVPQFEEWRKAGAFGPRVEVDEGADLQTKLLAEAGRRPS